MLCPEGPQGYSAKTQCWPMTSPLLPSPLVRTFSPSPLLCPKEIPTTSEPGHSQGHSQSCAQTNTAHKPRNTHTCTHMGTYESPALPSGTQMCKHAPSMPSCHRARDGQTLAHSHLCREHTHPHRAADPTPVAAGSSVPFNSASGAGQGPQAMQAEVRLSLGLGP